MSRIGIIGGSGVYNLEGINIIKSHKVTTPFGNPSSEIIEAELEGITCFFLPRHGVAHTILPHEINYRANIYALKLLGVEYLISASAVGSLKEELQPNSFFLPDQFIDWTKGNRQRTFFGDGIIAHNSNANPVCKKLQSIIFDSINELKDIHTMKDGSYICIEGPQFSTRAESNMYRSFAASVIGMTNVPESFLAKEAGMSYATIAMVTDMDAWKEHHCTVTEIMNVMKKNNINIQRVLKKLIPKLHNNKFEVQKENRVGLMTPINLIPKDKLEFVQVLLK